MTTEQTQAQPETRPSEVRSDALLADLGRMARRWRRGCGRPGGACCEQEWANKRADDRVKVCIKELEEFIAANNDLSGGR